jgi:GNAT superfamily N-acetyltransferase
MILYRPAVVEDSEAIASHICASGGGLYEFLFDDLVPFMTAADFIAGGVASEHYPLCYRNCLVAADAGSGRVLGVANVFPADELKHDRYSLLPSGRHDHVRAMLELQDWGSMFLNALAVGEHSRGGGIGSALLDQAESRARERGFDRLSLHAWADNTRALDLYKVRGFVPVAVADVAPHPRLPHVGGSILMRKAVAAR